MDVLSPQGIEAINAALPRCDFDRIVVNPTDAVLLRAAFPYIEGLGYTMAGATGVAIVDHETLTPGLMIATLRGRHMGIYHLYGEAKP